MASVRPPDMSICLASCSTTDVQFVSQSTSMIPPPSAPPPKPSVPFLRIFLWRYLPRHKHAGQRRGPACLWRGSAHGALSSGHGCTWKMPDWRSEPMWQRKKISLRDSCSECKFGVTSLVTWRKSEYMAAGIRHTAQAYSSVQILFCSSFWSSCLPKENMAAGCSMGRLQTWQRQCDTLSNVLLENLAPVIHVALTMTCTTYPIITADHLEPYIAAAWVMRQHHWAFSAR